MVIPTLLDVAALGEAVPGLAVVLPAALELHHGGGAAVAIDDAAVPGQGLSQALGLALDAHLHRRRVHRLVRVVAVAGDGAPVDHLGRYNVDDRVVHFSHGERKSGQRKRLTAIRQARGVVLSFYRFLRVTGGGDDHDDESNCRDCRRLR